MAAEGLLKYDLAPLRFARFLSHHPTIIPLPDRRI